MLIEQNERMMAENTKLREELNSTHFKLREANNQIAYLEFELESFKQDAGADIHNVIVSHKAKLAAAEALAVAMPDLIEVVETLLKDPGLSPAKRSGFSDYAIKQGKAALHQWEEA